MLFRSGHEVTIYEKGDRLGGQLNLAAKEPDSGYVFLNLVKHYETQLKRYEIPVNFNTEITKKNFHEMDAEVVVVATGAVVSDPLLDSKNPNIINTFDVLSEKVSVGDKAYILGGDRAGLVTAEFLASQGKEVSIIDERTRIAADVIATFKWRHLAWLKEYGINKMTGTRVEINDNNEIIIKAQDGDIAIDSLIVSRTRTPVQELYKQEFSCDEIYLIGDAVMPQSLHNAVHEGFKMGIRI